MIWRLGNLVHAVLAAASVLLCGAVDAADSVTTPVLPLQSMEMTAASDDLRAVADIVTGARVVGFGEEWHYVHEFLSMRNRLFVYMVEYAGVTAYAGETGFERGVVADDFVTGRSARSRDAISAVFYNTELAENGQLLDWIRAYNARSSTRRPIRLYGVDVSAGRSRPPWPATALDYIKQRDRSLAHGFEGRLQTLRSPLTDDVYAALSIGRRSELTKAVSDLVAAFENMRSEWVSQTSTQAFQWAYRSALVAQQADTQRRCEARQSAACEQLRDAAMADNLRWVLLQEGEQGRVFAFAHNWHLDKIGSQVASDGNGTVRSMGALLHEMLGAQYRVIGSMAGSIAGHEFSAGHGESLRGLEQLRRINLSRFVLDLRTDTQGTARLSESFDAMFFTDKAQPCHGCDAKLAMP